MKWAAKALQYYLASNLFTLVMDHAPLQWLHQVKDSNNQILHWYLALLPFSFQVQHRRGVQNANADFLSCCVPDDNETSVCVCVTARRPGTGGQPL